MADQEPLSTAAPLVVNGQHEHWFDPLANDQDWALVAIGGARIVGSTRG